MTKKEFKEKYKYIFPKRFESDINSVIESELKNFKDYWNNLPYEGINDIMDEDIDNYLKQTK